MKVRRTENYPEALILALGNPTTEAKLRSICYRLKEKGKTLDYAENKETTFLDMVSYGVGGVRFSQINKLFDRSNTNGNGTGSA